MSPIRVMLIDAGITEPQWRVLRVLEEKGPTDASGLADRACLLAPSLTRILQTMLEKQLISRTIDQDDRRRQLVAIAEKGQAILDNKAEEATAIANRLISVMGEDEVDQLLDLLNKLDEI